MTYKILMLSAVLFFFQPFAQAKELEILTNNWFSAPPFSMKCIKAEERVISERYDKKYVNVVLLIKNRSDKTYKLSGVNTYALYLQDTQGKIHPAEYFGKKAALYWYAKGRTMIDKELRPKEMVKARVTFLAPADSTPGKIIVRSLDYKDELKEIIFSEVAGNAKLFIPQHTLTQPKPATKEAVEKNIGLTFGARFSLFSSKSGSANFMYGAAVYHPLAEIGLVRLSFDATSYNDPSGKVSIIPLSLILSREIFPAVYAGLGGAYVIQDSSVAALSENTTGFILALGLKKALRENLLGNIGIQYLSGQGTSLGLEITLKL